MMTIGNIDFVVIQNIEGIWGFSPNTYIKVITRRDAILLSNNFDSFKLYKRLKFLNFFKFFLVKCG